MDSLEEKFEEAGFIPNPNYNSGEFRFYKWSDLIGRLCFKAVCEVEEETLEFRLELVERTDTSGAIVASSTKSRREELCIEEEVKKLFYQAFNVLSASAETAREFF